MLTPVIQGRPLGREKGWRLSSTFWIMIQLIMPNNKISIESLDTEVFVHFLSLLYFIGVLPHRMVMHHWGHSSHSPSSFSPSSSRFHPMYFFLCLGLICIFWLQQKWNHKCSVFLSSVNHSIKLKKLSVVAWAPTLETADRKWAWPPRSLNLWQMSEVLGRVGHVKSYSLNLEFG